MDVPNVTPEIWEQALANVTRGILNWLDRPGNEWWKNAFADNTLEALDDLCLLDGLYEAMDCYNWFGYLVWHRDYATSYGDTIFDQAVRRVSEQLYCK